METIVGFVIGYVVGTREGRAGVTKLVAAWQGISASPEVRSMLANAVGMAGPLLKEAASGGAGAMIGGVADLVVRRAGDALSDGRHAQAA